MLELVAPVIRFDRAINYQARPMPVMLADAAVLLGGALGIIDGTFGEIGHDAVSSMG